MKLEEYDISTIYKFTVSIEKKQLIFIYDRLMEKLGYPAHFWQGKSPSCEMEEFMKLLWKVIKAKGEGVIQ